jgi:hypothetical protein
MQWLVSSSFLSILPIGGNSSDTAGVECGPSPVGTYDAAAGAQQCTACPADATTVSTGSSSIAECFCDAGFHGTLATPDDLCARCPTGTYKNQPGDDQMTGGCTQCPPGSTSNSASTEIYDCVCAPGYFAAPGEDNCVQCPTDHYKNAPGPQACGSCPGGTVTAALASVNGACVCPPSPSFAFVACLASTDCRPLWDPVTQCLCGPGFFGIIAGSEDQCDPCPIGTYKDSASVEGCMSCPVGSTTENVGSTAISDCVCSAGYTGLGGAQTCTACEVSMYKDSTGPDACVNCPSHSTTFASESLDQLGEPSTASTAIQQCLCDPGYAGGTLASPDDTCSACPQGEYKATPGPSECLHCEAGATTSKTASMHIADCQCQPGSFALSENLCSGCPIGSFKDTLGPADCTSCPPDTTTRSSGSNSVSQCRCVPGSSGSIQSIDDRCTPCAEGSYKTQGGADECTVCPVGSTSSPGSTQSAQCICAPGYIQIPGPLTPPPSPGTNSDCTDDPDSTLHDVGLNCGELVPTASSLGFGVSCTRLPISHTSHTRLPISHKRLPISIHRLFLHFRLWRSGL